MQQTTIGGAVGETIDRVKRFVDDTLCALEDGCAHAYGWRVTRIGIGARSYRDPRFDITAAWALPCAPEPGHNQPQPDLR